MAVFLREYRSVGKNAEVQTAPRPSAERSDVAGHGEESPSNPRDVNRRRGERMGDSLEQKSPSCFEGIAPDSYSGIETRLLLRELMGTNPLSV